MSIHSFLNSTVFCFSQPAAVEVLLFFDLSKVFFAEYAKQDQRMWMCRPSSETEVGKICRFLMPTKLLLKLFSVLFLSYYKVQLLVQDCVHLCVLSLVKLTKVSDQLLPMTKWNFAVVCLCVCSWNGQRKFATREEELQEETASSKR